MNIVDANWSYTHNVLKYKTNKQHLKVGKNRSINEQRTNEWMNEWTIKRMNEGTDKQMNERKKERKNKEKNKKRTNNPMKEQTNDLKWNENAF